MFILAPIGLGNGPHVLGNVLHVLGNGLHLLGYGPYVLGNEPHVKSHIRVLLFEIMSHLGLCRSGLCHIQDCVVWLMSFKLILF